MAGNFFRRITKHFFIVINIIAAILFLLGCYGYFFHPSPFWPVGFLTLGAFYFLLVLVGFIFFWLFVKPVRALISIVAILMAYKPLSNLIPYRMPHSFNNQKAANALRIMSWNVAQFNIMEEQQHPEIKSKMLNIINENQPDIACFQEMVAEDSTVKNHGHLDEFLEKINLKNFFYSYNVKEDFWGYAHFGIIIFSKGNFNKVVAVATSFPVSRLSCFLPDLGHWFRTAFAFCRRNNQLASDHRTLFTAFSTVPRPSPVVAT